ncbi:MAG: carbohydrate ABC transporter permease [Treponema sp.]|nr:carbohydrate ABC transporter permease [Treponema sp.]
MGGTELKKTTRQKQFLFKKYSIKFILTILLWVLGIACIFPFLWMLSSSFKGVNDVYAFPIEWIPKHPTLDGYKNLFLGDFSFITFYRNSVFVASMALVGTFFSCTMAGYAYSKINFVGRDKIFLLKLSTTMIPGMVTMLPTFIIYRYLGLVNTLTALWLPMVFGGTFGVMLMRQNMISVPNELIESARIDGAGHPRIYWSIMLPSVRPSIATLLFMYFLWTWNDYERPLIYIQSRNLFTLPFAVKYFSNEQTSNVPAIMAANVVSMFIIIVLFFFCQKYFVRSVISSGIKG